MAEAKLSKRDERGGGYATSCDRYMLLSLPTDSLDNGSVAQLAEQLPLKETVGGSIPFRPTMRQ